MFLNASNEHCDESRTVWHQLVVTDQDHQMASLSIKQLFNNNSLLVPNVCSPVYILLEPSPNLLKSVHLIYHEASCDVWGAFGERSFSGLRARARKDRTAVNCQMLSTTNSTTVLQGLMTHGQYQHYRQV